MSKPEKTKLCWNCEGSVSRKAENCPYCAVYLNPETTFDAEEEKEEAPIKPFYSPKNQEEKGTIPKAPYEPHAHAAESISSQEAVAESKHENLLQSIFLPLIFLTAGLFSLLFALILVLFSTHGVLTLEWDGELWYIYAIAGLPLLFLGWKFLEKD